jgi:hypothetical protein
VLLAAVVVFVTAAAVSMEARTQSPTAPLQLLDVPYLPQTVALCGGAAAAMVMRYWGATGVYAETFADLVVPAAGGIRGEDLLRALESRGWNARSFRGDPAFLQTHLAARRPVIALIEDRPGQFHYVVVVGWSRGRVIAHDPARAPFRVLDEDKFIAAWEKADFWTMLALPAAAVPRVPAPASIDPSISSGTARPSPCSGMVDEGVRLAGSGDLAEARRLLALAAEACPESSAPWRELAGIHALQGEWAEADEKARQALARDKNDHHARRILATSLYLEGNHDGALAAWNSLDEPVLDLIDIKGLDRTRYAVVMGTMGLRPQTVLTAGALRTARRKLSQLPSAQTTRVSYRPGEGGRADVDAVVLERPLLPTSAAALAATGLRLLTDRELAVAVSSPTGGGEVWKASWRWWEARPRVALEFAAPAPFGGVWAVRGYAEQESYAPAVTAASDDSVRTEAIEERRRGVALSVSRWTGRGLRLQGAAGFDRWSGSRAAGLLSMAARQMFAGDRAYAEADVGSWFGGFRTWTGGVRSEWRSSTRNESHVFIARAGVETAGRAAPLSLWQGAGTGAGRDVLLRAHPLLDDGVVTSTVFGRTLAHGGTEWRRWSQLKGKPIRLAPAVFVDTARAWRGGQLADARWHMDIGAGLRVAVPGAGVLRVDLARGLRDGRTALSVGLTR